MGAHSDAAKLLRVHKGMMYRCFDSRSDSYRYYGGRGIVVCEEWVKSPARFIAWSIQNGYAIGLEIDRINNDGNYEPSNCRWVTSSENQRNKRQPQPKASKLKGIWKQRSRTNPWRAGLRINGKLLGLGSFATEDSAARAFDAAAVRYFGSRASLNFPQEATDRVKLVASPVRSRMD